MKDLTDERGFASIDLLIAKELAPNSQEEVQLALAYLYATVREGHLCVYQEVDDFKPSLIDMGIEQELHLSILEGLRHLPKELFSQKILYREDKRLYYGRYWEEEQKIIQGVSRMMATEPAIAVNKGHFLLKKSLGIISGGPGTGKTTLSVDIIRRFLEGISVEDRSHVRIALAAPTGKAAARLQEAMGELLPSVQAQTLHRLLGIYKKRPSSLNEDLILVDECSMVDVHLMATLFSSVKEGARLILVGDRDQLPPVEAGSVFADLVIHAKSVVLVLTGSKRTKSKELQQFAQAVCLGDVGCAFAAMKGVITHNTLEKFPQFSNNPGKFCLLSPLRKGVFGVDNLNAYYHKQQLAKADPDLPFLEPIMLVQNDYDLGMFNGEVGTLIKNSGPYGPLQEGDRVLFSGGKETSALLLPKYEYAYCLSVHKSQGSEFDHVHLLLPEGSERFGREMLYTAITRAKKSLSISGSIATIRETIHRSHRRLSGLISLRKV